MPITPFQKTAAIVFFVCCGTTMPSLFAEDARQSSAAAKQLETVESAKLHPLMHVIELATKGLERTDREIKEYSCLLIKREKVDGELTQREYMRAKIRHRRLDDGELVVPFSVYLKFLKPSSVAGREVLYVENQRNGDLLARRGGPRLANITVELDPTGHYAMQGNRHPITEIGFRNLVHRLIENMRADLSSDDVEVQYYDDAKLADRPCEHIVVTHRRRTEAHDYQMARVFIDKELGVPVFFASYDWPSNEGGEPELKEEYIFTDIVLNPGFTDLDFDAGNPRYAFEPLASQETLAKFEP
ncbi:MAG: DUF1571 domain-containing protein [Pirellulaceae bacterium]